MAIALLLGCFYASRGMEIIKCVATHPTPDIGKTHRHLHNLYNSRDIATVGLRATQERASAVMAQHVKDSIGKKFLLVLLKLASLPGIVHRTLALFIGILLLSESVAANTAYTDSPPFLRQGVHGGQGISPSLAQQPATSSPNATTTDKQQAYERGQQLLDQAQATTAIKERQNQRQQALAKYEEALSNLAAIGG
jgi:hypothetical protein